MAMHLWWSDNLLVQLGVTGLIDIRARTKAHSLPFAPARHSATFPSRP
jgi:hypothetical protein